MGLHPKPKPLYSTPAQPKPPATAMPPVTQPTAANMTSLKPLNTNPADELAKMVATDSNMMQQASTKGMAASNSRGLLNSSMSVGASMDAMANAAIPLAQQTASQNFETNRQQTQIEAEMQMQSRELTSREQAQIRDIEANAAAQGRELTAAEQAQIRDIEANIATQARDIDARFGLLDRELTASEQAQIRGIEAEAAAQGRELTAQETAQIRDIEARATAQQVDIQAQRDAQVRDIRANAAAQNRDITASEQAQIRDIEAQNTRDQLDADLQQQIASWNLDAQQQADVSNTVLSYQKIYEDQVTNIMANENLSASQRETQLKAAETRLNASIELTRDLYSVDIVF